MTTTQSPPRQGLRVRLGETANADWNAFNVHHTLTQTFEPVIERDAAIFTMGSCFAHEIRRTLREAGHRVVPAYGDIRFDRSRIRIGRLPERENVNYYHSFAIRQELERIVVELLEETGAEPAEEAAPEESTG